MASRQRTQIGFSTSTAVFVRLLAFVVALVGLFVLPATVVGVTTGHMTREAALLSAGAAVLLVALATLAVRPFDPLRR